MNRFIRSIALAGLVTLLVATGGCDLTSLNDNPNQPTQAEAPKLLANAQISIAEEVWQDYAGGFWVRYAQYWTTNQYTDADRYAYAPSRPGALNALWEDLYLALNDLQEIKRINRSRPDLASANGPNPNQIAIADIMQVWTLHFMTDVWGPVPLAEALKGQEDGNFSPAYNSGAQVYTAMIDSLTRASNNIQTDAPTLAGSDLVYSGDMSKWKKFANSLKLRIALRASGKGNGLPSGVTQDQVNTWISDALDAGVMESNADNALIPFSADPPYQNPFYENRVRDGRRDWAAPESILEPMNSLQDPRRPAYFEPTPSGEFVGFPYGLPQSEAQALFTSSQFSVPSERVASTATAPCIMMLYDEVEFAQAEIALRSDLSGASGANTHFDQALRASLEYWGVSDTGTQDAFLNRVGDLPGSFNQDAIQKLGTQKWIAQYLQGVQGWSTWRRLDFTGVLRPPKGNPGQEAFGRDIALRMTYPNDEFTLNQSNVNNAIGSLLGGDGAEDTQGVQLWWDTEYVDPDGS